jgi:hypothetical protein
MPTIPKKTSQNGQPSGAPAEKPKNFIFATEDGHPPQLRVGEVALESVEDYTTMTDETLVATALQALQVVHEYEFLVLYGSSRSERAWGRAAKDRLGDVCFEIGVRHLAERFKDMISQHKDAYQTNLKELREEDEHSTGRLSWWNV